MAEISSASSSMKRFSWVRRRFSLRHLLLQQKNKETNFLDYQYNYNISLYRYIYLLFLINTRRDNKKRSALILYYISLYIILIVIAPIRLRKYFFLDFPLLYNRDSRTQPISSSARNEKKSDSRGISVSTSLVARERRTRAACLSYLSARARSHSRSAENALFIHAARDRHRRRRALLSRLSLSLYAENKTRSRRRLCVELQYSIVACSLSLSVAYVEGFSGALWR